MNANEHENGLHHGVHERLGVFCRKQKNNFTLFMYFMVNFVFHEWLRKRKSAI